MRLWHRTREELSGAWRSLRYDLGRRRDPGRFARPPYRVMASAFGLLALVGATGSYLAVVDGLGALLAEPVVARRLPVPPPVAVPRSPGTGGPAPTAPIGYGSTLESRRTTAVVVTPTREGAAPAFPRTVRTSAAPARPRVPTTTRPVTGAPPTRTRPTGTRPTGTRPTGTPPTGTPPAGTPEESAGTPPVPTRTSPPAHPSPGAGTGPSGSPSGRPSESARSPSARQPSPTPSPRWSIRPSG